MPSYPSTSNTIIHLLISFEAFAATEYNKIFRADSRVKVRNLSNISGSDSIPTLRMGTELETFNTLTRPSAREDLVVFIYFFV